MSRKGLFGNTQGRGVVSVAAIHSASKLRSLKTGEPVEVTLYHGEGETTNRIPSQYAEGQHWSPYEEVARTYGPNVREETIQLENPHVFTLPGEKPYYDELADHFGTHDPHQIAANLIRARRDALVVRNVPVMRARVTMRDSIEVILLRKTNQPKKP